MHASTASLASLRVPATETGAKRRKLERQLSDVSRIPEKAITTCDEPGPLTPEESMDYGADIFSSLTPEQMIRFIMNLWKKLYIRTYYSGMDCFFQSILLLFHHLLSAESRLPHGVELSEEDRAAWRGKDWPVKHVHACDSASSCRTVLMEWSDSKTRAKHLFGDLTNRVDKGKLKAMVTKHNEFHAEFERWRETMHSLTPTTPSYEELRKTCLANLNAASREATTMLTTWLTPEDFPDGAKDYCYMCRQMCPVDDLDDCPEDAMVGVIAGNTCVDHSTRGTMQHFLGESAIPLAVFLSERRKRKEAFVITECTQLFNISIYVEAVGDIYMVKSFKWSPHFQGIASLRLRRFTFLLRKDLVIVSIDFGIAPVKFLRRRTLDADAMLIDDADILQHEWTLMARAAGQPSSTHLKKTPLHLLSTGDQNRLEEYIALAEENCSAAVVGVPGRAIICDISQHPPFSTPGDMFAGMGTKTIYVSLRKARPVIAIEHLIAQGVPLNGIVKGVESPLQLQVLKRTDIVEMAGNGIHLKVMATVFVHMLSNIERKHT